MIIVATINANMHQILNSKSIVFGFYHIAITHDIVLIAVYAHYGCYRAHALLGNQLPQQPLLPVAHWLVITLQSMWL